jgi:hypothetical protein
MNVTRRSRWNAVIALALATGALGMPAPVPAGPGCLHEPRLVRGFPPHGPVAPQSAYPYSPYAYPARPAPQAMGTAPALPPARVVAPATGAEQTVAAAADGTGATAVEGVTARLAGMRFEPSTLTVDPRSGAGRSRWARSTG